MSYSLNSLKRFYRDYIAYSGGDWELRLKLTWLNMLYDLGLTVGLERAAEPPQVTEPRALDHKRTGITWRLKLCHK